MKEAAAAFERAGGAKVEVVSGPTPQWLPQAKADADIVYSGSETMMTDFVAALEPQLAHREVTPLHLRPLALLVRPGNPRRIRAFEDLLRPGTSILVDPAPDVQRCSAGGRRLRLGRCLGVGMARGGGAGRRAHGQGWPRGAMDGDEAP
jgi:accessory colonization factor AcfC